MPFDLRITFSGLCLFVPDPSGTKMHILMPRGPTHTAVLTYDKSREAQGSTGLTTPVRLEDGSIDLSALPNSGFSLALPPQVANIYPVIMKKLTRDHLKNRPPQYLRSRITVPHCFSATVGTKLAPKWNLGPYTCIEMAAVVIWTVPIKANQLEWKRTNLTNGTEDTIKTLNPDTIGGERILDLRVVNVPEHDTCEVPDSLGYISPHFKEYYKLFPTNGPDPMLVEFPHGHKPGQSCAAFVDFGGGSPYTCMVAQTVFEEGP